MKILDPLFRCSAANALFSDDATLQRMLDFEAALAHASVDLLPDSTAAQITSAIASKCRVELFDKAKLAEATASAGNIAIPLINQLKAHVAVDNSEAANFVHLGATSQDLIDTAQILQVRDAFILIHADLRDLCSALATLTTRHRNTPIVGRTWMQHAVPTTLGMKFAGWLDALERHRQRLRETQTRCLVLQFGGAVGTLASLGQHGHKISERLAAELELPTSQIPWHSHRDRTAEVATTLGLLTGTLGKIARDLSLHMQTEIAEILERAEEGRGGSSTMPHKRNPVAAAAILAAATRVPGLVSTMLSAMVHEDERALGTWHAEWETLPEIVCLSAGALHRLKRVVPKLRINVERMRQNLNATSGRIFTEALTASLGQKIGRAKARSLIETASDQSIQENRHLREILEQQKEISTHFSSTDLDNLFNPQNYTGAAYEFIDRVLAHHQSQSKT